MKESYGDVAQDLVRDFRARALGHGDGPGRTNGDQRQPDPERRPAMPAKRERKLMVAAFRSPLHSPSIDHPRDVTANPDTSRSGLDRARPTLHARRLSSDGRA
jgi:hypothetical protein